MLIDLRTLRQLISFTSAVPAKSPGKEVIKDEEKTETSL